MTHSISDIAIARGISEIHHFTTNRGLVGMLAKGELLSRKRVPDDELLEYILHVNSEERPEKDEGFDKSEEWIDYVNLSISEINARYFRLSSRRSRNAEVWWVIVTFDAEIISHPGVYFATTNNGYPYCIRRDGPAGMMGLFDSPIRRKPNWSAHRGNREGRLPTCEQAEVLYPGAVQLRWLRKIYVREDNDSDRVKGWLNEFGFEGVEVVIDPAKFQGREN